jgi:triosephosphate isomerase
MSRKKLIAGNWKMFTNRQSAGELAAAIAKGLPADPKATVVVCPPFPWVALVADAVKGTAVHVGAQDCAAEKGEGAFTGEVSPNMLMDAGAQYVILGHSERRHVLGEPDTLINDKMHTALEVGMNVILCVGETLAERERGLMERVFQRQLFAGTSGLTDEQFGRLAIAYEPVWAIGTGKVATPAQAQAAQEYLRSKLAVMFGDKIAQSTPILYGGSVKPDNAAGLLSLPDVDGALVGGASLKADQFLGIVAAA